MFRGDKPEDQFTAATGVRRALAKAAGAGRHWSSKAAPVDAFDAKGDALAVLAAAGAPAQALQVVPGGPAWFHPGRSGTIQIGPQNVLGHFGELHPRALEALDAEGPLAGFEVILERIPEAKAKATRAKPVLELSPFQPVTRDFAFVVDRAVKAGDIVRAAQNVDRKLITGVSVFDVYEGQGIEAGKKSIAIAVTIQPREKTMTDAEIDALGAKIVAEVSQAHRRRAARLTLSTVALRRRGPSRIDDVAAPWVPACRGDDGGIACSLRSLQQMSGSDVMEMSVKAPAAREPGQADAEAGDHGQAARRQRQRSRYLAAEGRGAGRAQAHHRRGRSRPRSRHHHLSGRLGEIARAAVREHQGPSRPQGALQHDRLQPVALLPDDRREAGRSSAQGGADPAAEVRPQDAAEGGAGRHRDLQPEHRRRRRDRHPHVPGAADVAARRRQVSRHRRRRHHQVPGDRPRQRRHLPDDDQGAARDRRLHLARQGRHHRPREILEDGQADADRRRLRHRSAAVPGRGDQPAEDRERVRILFRHQRRADRAVHLGPHRAAAAGARRDHPGRPRLSGRDLRRRAVRRVHRLLRPARAARRPTCGSSACAIATTRR